MKLTKKAAVKLSDHTHITCLLSTLLTSCNLNNEFRSFVPHMGVRRGKRAFPPLEFGNKNQNFPENLKPAT